MLKTYFFPFLTALCLLLSPAAQAQIQAEGPETLSRPEETPWSHVADSVLLHLDKAQIPSGILYDRVVPYAALPYFNRFRVDTSSADTSGFGYFRQSVSELHAASYNPAVLPCQQDVRDYAQLRLARDTVAIGVLHYRFGALDSTAVANNLVYWDGNTPAQLHNVPGRRHRPTAAGSYCGVLA